MGKLLALRSALQPLDVYKPVNYRPTEICRTIMFDPEDGNGYEDRFDAVGVQYARGEEGVDGYYAVKLPEADGPLIRWIEYRPAGTVCVSERKHARAHELLPRGEVNILGRIFQFIRPLDSDERWELIRGPAHEGEGEEETGRPLYEMSGH